MTSKIINNTLNKARQDAKFLLDVVNAEISELEDSLALRKSRKADLEEQISDFTSFLGDANEY